MDDAHAQESNSLFQKINKITILAQCPLFAGLSQWELKSISQRMRLVEFKRDETVYEEGRPADGFYVVVSGRFEAYVSSGTKKKVLAYLRRGDHFGEMSLLTREPHSATLRALSDSLVLELKKDDFEHTVEHNATISLELSRRLSHRLRGDNTHTKTLFRSDVFSVFSHQSKKERSQFSLNLAASLFHETHQKTVLIDLGVDPADHLPGLEESQKPKLSNFREFGAEAPDPVAPFITKHGAGFDMLSLAVGENGSAEENSMIAILNHLSIEYRFILIDLPSEMSSLIVKTLSHADFIFFVTDSHINNIHQTQEMVADIEKMVPSLRGSMAVVMREIFFGARTTNLVRNELFSNKRCFSLPAPPFFQEDEDPKELMLVYEPDAEYSRVVRHIARFVSNNLVGLVLGSGAAFGLAHIGVLKVLEREKIPIDVIAGSSVGALIGSVYAVCQDAEEVERMAMGINLRLLMTKLIDVSVYPVRGFLNGRGVIKHLGKYLGNKTFENCRIPLKITGTNLSTRESMIFDSGLLAEAVRASIAIPSIFKPVFIAGETIVDGGILDPLPIKALHDAGVHKIIAVNVFPTTKDTMERRILQEDAAIKESQVVRQKNFLIRFFYTLKKRITRFFFPNIFDILMNTIQFMESEIAEIQGESADLLIRPVLPNANWVEFYKPAPFIKKGEEETMKLLPKIKALVAQQNA